MPTRTTLLAALVGALLLPPQTAHGATSDALTACPGYRAALDQARGALTRGARAEAVEALERAKVALERCNQHESAGGGTSHAARMLAPTA